VRFLHWAEVRPHRSWGATEESGGVGQLLQEKTGRKENVQYGLCERKRLFGGQPEKKKRGARSLPKKPSRRRRA